MYAEIKASLDWTNVVLCALETIAIIILITTTIIKINQAQL